MALAAEPARLKGRFDAQHSDDELLEVVAKVARHARPDDPTSVTQRVFNANRAPAGEPGCPQANQITTRLTAGRVKRGWRDILVLACDETRDAKHSLTPNAPDPDIDERYCYFALRRVHTHLVNADRLDKATGMTTDLYDAGREELLATEGRKRIKHRPLADKLPTSGQVLRVFSDWDTALNFATLTTRAATPPAKAVFAASFPAEQAAVEFIKANGFWPSADSLREFARLLDLRMGPVPPAKELRDKTTLLLVTQGIRVPTKGAPRGRGAKLKIKLPKGGIPGAPTRTDADWTEEKVIERLADWLEGLPARTTTTLKAYRAATTANDYYPSHDTIQRHADNFTAALKRARKVVQTRRSFRSGP